MLKVGIIGVTGYAGIELLRLLHAHPQVEVAHIVSDSSPDTDIAQIYPHFAGARTYITQKLDTAALGRDCDMVFCALPHQASAAIVPEVLEAGAAVIDLSADFRYADEQVYAHWYAPHPRPDLLAHSVYGLPELHLTQLHGARLVGNPGCYPTAGILALAPALHAGLVRTDSIIIDAMSGVTGAGRKAEPGVHFCEVDQNCKAYKVATHRHTSEIEQELAAIAGHALQVSFTPHLVPVKRGILATCYASLHKAIPGAQLYELYTDFYKAAPFVHICAPGTLPELKHVNGSNYCHIGLVSDARTGRLIVVSAIDNLVKGAAGQAIQNMNILAGLEQTIGLTAPAWYL